MGDGENEFGLRKGYFITKQQRDNIYQLMQDDEKRKKPFELVGVDRIFFPYKIEDLVECTLPSYEVMAYKYVKKQVAIEAIQDEMKRLETATNEFLLSDATDKEKETRKRIIAEFMRGDKQKIEDIRTDKIQPDSVLVNLNEAEEKVKIGWREKMGIEVGGQND